MHKTLAALLIAGLAAAGAPAALGAQPPSPQRAPADGGIPVDRIVAVAGKEPILLSELEERFAQAAAQAAQQGRPIPTDSASQRQLRLQLLNSLINEELMVEYARDHKVEVQDADLTPQVDEQIRRVRERFSSEAEYRDELRRSGFGSPEEYRRWLTEQERRRALQEKLVSKLRQEGKLVPVPVSDAEVAQYFEENRAQIPRLPASVAFRQVVIAPQPSAAAKARTQAKAESLLAEIRRGGDFAQIARRESMDPQTKDIGGDLGWLRRGATVPEFERWMVIVPPGEVSPVFETYRGYHIIKVERVQPGEFKVRQILLVPPIDSADVRRARQEADSVARALRAGVSYDSLVAKHHDPLEERSIPQIARSQLPESYQRAFEGQPAGAIPDPFEIEDKTRGVPKFVVAQLTEVTPEREPTLADFREQIRQQLSQERSFLRLLENLKKQTYVDIRL
jgi:peptidyl-prolyl cis-trans isomerase SurA